jgi:hypothetical protein
MLVNEPCQVDTDCLSADADIDFKPSCTDKKCTKFAGPAADGGSGTNKCMKSQQCTYGYYCKGADSSV